MGKLDERIALYLMRRTAKQSTAARVVSWVVALGLLALCWRLSP